MPQDSGGGHGTNLGLWIDNWQDIRAQIKEMKDGGATDNALRTLVTARAALVDKIQQFVKNHPGRRNDAIDLGFREDLLPGGGDSDHDGKNDPPRDPDDLGGPTQGGGGGDGDGDSDPTKPPKDDKGPPGPGGANPNSLLPKGKEVVRRGNKTYVMWKYKIRGKVRKFMWRVPADKMKTYGIGDNEGRQLGKAEFDSINFFGSIDEFVIEGDKDVLEQWIDQFINRYEGTSILKNKEVFGVFMEGFAEGWDRQEIQNQLRLTKWWDSRTRYQRRWESEMTSTEKRKTLRSTEQKLKDELENLYGDNWRQHVKGGAAKVREWAEKIASGTIGAMGNPEDGFDLWFRRVKNDAEKIENTPAWIADQQEKIGEKEFINAPEDMAAQLREQAVQWLGYGYTPAKDTLQKWAEDLVFERRSDADWQKFLRQQKQAIHPWLDPDETWMDGIGAFKSIADGLMGTSLSYKDPLFSSVIKTDPDGNPVNDGTTRMSAWDFEKLVKRDQRWWGTKAARDQLDSWTSFLDQRFNGAAA